MLLSRRASILSSTLFRRTFYDSKTKNDTIFATATSASNNKGSPLAVIRISGAKTSNILNEITQKQAPKPRHATLTKILDPRTRELVDSGLVLWFPRPNSYTGEDVCELHLHGSHAIVTKMLTTLGSVWPGVRPAEPGEFTRRAVMNGKMSLMQAESLPDLIKSHTDSQRRLALNGLDGSTREKYDQWTEKLVGILAHLEASIDFGEDELLGESAVAGQCIEELKRLAGIVDNYIESSARCRDFVVDGVSIAILGKPNAGKSTFMNLLCRRDLSIVSDLSGTTRDLVRHSIEIGGHSVILCDTAGLKNLDSGDDESTNTETLLDKHRSIEQEGIRRALEAARKADVLIYLVDGSTCRPNSQFVNQINSELGAALGVICSGSEESAKPKVLHLIMNKIDLNVHLKSDNCMTQLKEMMKKKLEQQQHEQQQQRSLCVADISLISCKTQENFDQFACTLVERLDELCSPPAATSVKANGPVQFDYVNQRHLSLLKSMHRHLELAGRMDLATIDMMAQHVRESIDYLSRIVGSITSEDVIDVIFRDFCIGK